ncbi:MAG TPA: hypothetical protein VFR97_15165 [Capillimicrobium sp.]|nr:hypothetical protein [Capillimicrobium sp.]
MTAFRLISLPLHGAIELMIGLGLMAAPFLLGFEAAGLISALAVGALVCGLALGAANAPEGRIDVTAHFAYDLGLVAGLFGAGLALALGGDPVAGITFVGAAAASMALNVTTRYSARR